MTNRKQREGAKATARKKQPGVMFYMDMLRTLYDLPDEKLIVLFRALVQAILFSKYKDEPDELDGDPVLFAIYEGFMHRIFDDAEHYKEVCETKAEAGRQKGKAK